MSFLARIAARAVEVRPAPTALQPKDRLRRFRGLRAAEEAETPEAEDDASEPAAAAPEGEALAARSAAARTPAARLPTTEGTSWAEEDYDTDTTEGVPARRAPIRREGKADSEASPQTPLRLQTDREPGDPLPPG